MSTTVPDHARPHIDLDRGSDAIKVRRHVAALLGALPLCGPRLAIGPVAVPVTAVPDFSDAEMTAQLERVHGFWQRGWTLTEQLKRVKATDGEKSTLGGRYLDLVQRAPWLSLALESAGVTDPKRRLVLMEQWLSPILEWDHEELTKMAQWVGSSPPLEPSSDARQVHVLTEARWTWMTVAHDLGGAEWVDPAVDEWGRPSHKVAVARAIGIGQKAKDDTHATRGADKALVPGRRLLCAIGAWPWAHFADGALPTDWFGSAGGPVREWLRAGRAHERIAMSQRDAAADRALTALTVD